MAGLAADNKFLPARRRPDGNTSKYCVRRTNNHGCDRLTPESGRFAQHAWAAVDSTPAGSGEQL